MPLRTLCSFSLPADLKGRQFFTDCVLSPLHDGAHVVGSASHRSASLHEVSADCKNLSEIIHAQTETKLGRKEMGSLLEQETQQAPDPWDLGLAVVFSRPHD